MSDLIEDLYKISTVTISLRHIFSLRPRVLNFTLEDVHNMRMHCIDNTGEFEIHRSYALSRDFFVVALEEIGNFLHSPASYGTPTYLKNDHEENEATSSPLPDTDNPQG